MATPRFSCCSSRPLSQAKLDHSADHAARSVGEHAVEIGGPVHQLDGLEIAVAELHGARQRQLDRRQVRHLRGARVELAVGAHAHDPQRLAGHDAAGLTTWRCVTGVLPMSFGS